MIKLVSRRALLRRSAIGATGLLAGCTIVRGGSTTTATLDVKRIVTDGRAILTMLSTALSMPLVVAALGPDEAPALAAVAAAQVVLTGIEQLTGGTITATIDTTRLQALVTSLLVDAQSALVLVQKAIPKLQGAVGTRVANLTLAALSLVPLVQLAAGLATARAPAGSMSEADALRLARS